MAARAKYYAYLARLYFECADAADRKIGLLPGFEIVAPPPVMLLCAQAVELAQKSFLLRHGWTLAETRALNHDLVKGRAECLETSKKAGVVVATIDDNVLKYISDLHAGGSLRYGEKSWHGRAPVYGPLSQLVEACLSMCSAPKLSDLVAD